MTVRYQSIKRDDCWYVYDADRVMNVAVFYEEVPDAEGKAVALRQEMEERRQAETPARNELAGIIARTFAGMIHNQDEGEWAASQVLALLSANAPLVVNYLAEIGYIVDSPSSNPDST